jgi:hypothetical protein
MKKHSVKNIVKLAEQINNIITRFGLLPERYDGIAADMADIYEASSKYISILDDIINDEDMDRKKLADVLIGLEVEILDHMAFHLGEIKKPLNILIEDLS